MSVIYNITLFVFCFNMAGASSNAMQLFDDSGDNQVIDMDLMNPNNAQDLDDRIYEMNTTSSSWISNLTPDFIESGADFVRGTYEAISLFMVGVVQPAQAIDNACQQIANDPDMSGTCNTTDGIGSITKWINRIVWITYIFFAVQFLANRSFRGIE